MNFGGKMLNSNKKDTHCVNYLRKTRIDIPEELRDQFQDYNSLRANIYYCKPENKSSESSPVLLESEISFHLINKDGSYEYFTSISGPEFEDGGLKKNDKKVVDRAKELAKNNKFLVNILKQYITSK